MLKMQSSDRLTADDRCAFHVCLHPFNGNTSPTVTTAQMRRKSFLAWRPMSSYESQLSALRFGKLP